MVNVIDELLAELIAIWVWDDEYLRRRSHDQIDRVAQYSRRMREAEIVATLVTRFLRSGEKDQLN